MNERSLHDQALHVAREYGTLIRSLHETTDRLLETLAQPGIEAAGALMESRSALCDRLVECGETLKSLIGDSARESLGSDLQSMMTETRASLRSLGEKQKACEAALAGSMDRCRADLAALDRQSGACLAYQGGHRKQDARFLDIVR